MERSLTSPTPRAGRAWILFAGDLLAFLVFAAIGRRSHGEAAGIAAIVEVGRTAAPFIGGWLLVAPVLGAYRSATTASMGAMARRTALTWLVALLPGAGLRAIDVGRLSPPSFYVVTFLVLLALLCGWRTAFAWCETRSARSARSGTVPAP